MMRFLRENWDLCLVAFLTGFTLVDMVIPVLSDDQDIWLAAAWAALIFGPIDARLRSKSR